ncbi:hypothetical protein J2736_006802, partial [Paenibacillus qinlingensis]|nr:hypothetical protein [Paenibacillus qinlingensis]
DVSEVNVQWSEAERLIIDVSVAGSELE